MVTEFAACYTKYRKISKLIILFHVYHYMGCTMNISY